MQDSYLIPEGVSFLEVPSGFPVTAHPIRAYRHTKDLLVGYIRACRALRSFQPDAVIGFGSYHSLPALLAAKTYGIPLFLHEQNIVPGKVNQLFSRFAHGVGIAFPPAQRYFSGHVKTIQLPKRDVQEPPKQSSHTPKISIIGGSQGARILNQIAPLSLISLKSDYPNLYVQHITGPKEDDEAVARLYQKERIAHCVKRVETDVLSLLLSSDLVISRAGATIMDELLWAKIPSIMIPYPGAYGHQLENANFFAYEVGGGEVIEQKDLSSATLSHKLKHALSPEVMQARQNALKRFHEKQTAKSFYQFVCERL